MYKYNLAVRKKPEHLHNRRKRAEKASRQSAPTIEPPDEENINNIAECHLTRVHLAKHFLHVSDNVEEFCISAQTEAERPGGE
ncbi:MAG: hypothetical protein ACRC31_06145 [Cetobacterium sp.]